MPYARLYTLAEIKGMLQIYKNNYAIHGVNAAHKFVRATHAAHADVHSGADFLALQARVNTPGEPRTTGTYWNDSDQANATLEVLNSPAGQLLLATLDNAALPAQQKRAAIDAPLVGNYKVAEAVDRSNAPGTAGHLARAAAARVGAGSVQTVRFALRGFVLAVPGVGGQLQIQTSYPSG